MIKYTARNPLLENIKAKKTSIGAFCYHSDMIRLMAYLGFDFAYFDMMFTPVDWSTLDSLITTCEASGITPMVRVQSNPWLGYDHRIAVDVTRAQGVGAQFVSISVSGKKEVEECLMVSKDWHRRSKIIHPPIETDPEARVGGETYISVGVETKTGIEQAEEIMALPGMKIFRIPMTDASMVVTGSDKPDFYHPKLWEYVRKITKIGKERGITIQANATYAPTLDEMIEQAKMLQDAGVQIILLEGTPYLCQLALGEFTNSLRKTLNLPERKPHIW